MTEWGRVKRKVNDATDEQIKAWREPLEKRLFECGLADTKSEFLRKLSNAYHKFPQYREPICEVLGVRADAAIDRGRLLFILVLTVIGVSATIIMLCLMLSEAKP